MVRPGPPGRMSPSLMKGTPTLINGLLFVFLAIMECMLVTHANGFRNIMYALYLTVIVTALNMRPNSL